MTDGFKPTDNQARAINQLNGRLFIAAGAGSGKTAVVARRFIEAIARGEAEVDQILTITFTKKAAAEMMNRVRKVLREEIAADPDPERAARMRQAYRDIERARISTMDSFYARVLRSNALAAGIDPDFAAVDESRSLLIKEEAFDACLKDFVASHGQAGADLVLAYDRNLAGSLFKVIDSTYATFRSQGRKPQLPAPDVEASINQCRLRLQAAIDDFDEAVKVAGCTGKTVDTILETNWHLRGAIKAPDLETREDLLAKGQPKRNLPKVKAELDELKDAWAAYTLALKSQRALGTLMLIADLLADYDRAYGELKYTRGVLDFEDLSLLTRDLLVGNPAIAERLRKSFRLIMVDEFQDTNPLQQQIAEMIADDNLMMVGDANQSIFGFRDAEVTLFRDEEKLAVENEYRVALRENFRSQPEILTFADELFRDPEMLGEGYLKLEPAAEIDPREEDCRIELILVDQEPPGSEKKLAADDARRAEAQLIAERLQQLFGQSYTSGDAAILVATRTGVDIYRDALERMGISNYLAIGVSYFEQLHLGDVINMFRLIVNPLDDEALVAVLRSPFVRVADDTLFRLRQIAGVDSEGNPVPLWTLFHDDRALGRFIETERERLSRFAADLVAMRESSARSSLQQVAARVIHYNDYAATTAIGFNGKQALANLMKLLDLAADYESVWGPDLAAFTEFLSYQKAVKAREADAPIEEEGVNAVRIMTMHTAKGLEFPLVILPKLGADTAGKRQKPTIIVDRDADSGRIGLEYRDTNSGKDAVFDYDELAAEKRARDAEEGKRLHYVAMTRAERHLVLVGYGKLEEPARADEGARPLDWIRRLLSLDRESRPDLDAIGEIDAIEGARIRLQVCGNPGEVLARAEAAATAHELAEESVALNPDVNRQLDPSMYVPPVISPTSLQAFSDCPRRYYLQHVLGAGSLLDVKAPAGSASGGGALNATQMGTLVHKILETDIRRALETELTEDYLRELMTGLFEDAVELTAADCGRAARLVSQFAGMKAAAELLRAEAAGDLSRELRFSTLVGGTIVSGFIDALCPIAIDGGHSAGTLVVDYKTGDPGASGSVEAAANAYRLQMDSYALAAGRLNPGPVRVVLAFLGGEEPVEFVQEFTADDLPELEAGLRSVIDSMASGEFPPMDRTDGYHCTWCVAGGNGAGLCSQARS